MTDMKINIQMHIFITTNVDVEEAYLQQQVHYTVKLHLGKDLQRGSLSSPTLENADIRQIGKDKEYNEVVEGRRYRIIERSFTIIPQQSGSFIIEGPLFEGEVIDNRDKVDDNIINFKPIVTQILNAQFIQILPSTFKKNSNNDEGDEDRPKKKKKQNQEDSRLVKNSGRISNWIATSDDDYQKFFAGKHLGLRPKFQGRPMCQRFHTKGHCFSDCINVITHVTSTDIPADIQEAYSKYCSKCKEDF